MIARQQFANAFTNNKSKHLAPIIERNRSSRLSPLHHDTLIGTNLSREL